jgi:hypothetical protein
MIKSLICFLWKGDPTEEDLVMYKFYTGVGSRKTPTYVLEIMALLAKKIERLDWSLRTGDATGADMAFRDAVSPYHCEVYTAEDCTPDAMEIARRFHPAWDRCSEYAQRLHGRNAFQVLGSGLDLPSWFLVCWTPDGAVTHKERSIKTGGTGTAISIAYMVGVPVFNLQRSDHRDRVTKFIKKGGE